jgi:hypothetical protein
MTLDYHVQWLAFDGLATAGQQVVGMGVYTVVLGPVVWICLGTLIRRLRITEISGQLGNLSVYALRRVRSVARQARSKRSRAHYSGFLEPG